MKVIKRKHQYILRLDPLSDLEQTNVFMMAPLEITISKTKAIELAKEILNEQSPITESE